MEAAVGDVCQDARTSVRPSATEVIAATTVGNALEFFDFTAYNFFAVLLGKLFYPALSPTLQLVLSTGTFAVGYFFRPLGGVLIGAYADRIGRKAALTLTIGLMAFSSLLIGLAPTYAQVGAWAPAIILVSRIMQGVSAGGEVGASTALLVEHAGARRRGFFGSFQFASQSLGIALGASMSAILAGCLSEASLASWGWRVVFLLGTLIAPVGMYIRLRMAETLHRDEDAGAGGLLHVLSSHLRELLTGTVLTFGGTSANFIILFSLPIIAVTSLGMSQGEAAVAGIVTGVTGFVTSPLGGAASDLCGRKPVIWASRLLVCVTVVPAFAWLRDEPSLTRLLIVEGALSAVAAFGGATAIGSMTELFPAPARATGMAIVYSLGIALSGLVAQFVATYVVGIGSNIMPAAWYVVGCLILTSGVLFWMPEVNPRCPQRAARAAIGDET